MAKSSSGKKKNYKILRFTSVAFQMMVIIGGGALLGKYLDGEKEGFATYTITLTLLGVVVGMYLVIKEAFQITKDN